MIEFFRNLFASDFMPHGMCYFWTPQIMWLHALSDGIIALSYYVIPVALVYFVRQRKDLAFHWMFLLFGLFIFGCGTTHVMEIWTLWHGTYRLAGVIKAVTAAASVLTAVLLVKLLPQALALPSPSHLRTANENLEREIAERRRAEAALQEARDELEVRVQQRTAELARVNDELLAEIVRRHAADYERQQVEQALSKMQGELAHVVRVTTMGELAASIAHEVNQPLTAVITNANACLRWLAAEPPNLEEARQSLTRIVRDGDRAAEVLKRIRALVKKSAPEAAPLDVNDVLHEVLTLVQDSLASHEVATTLELGRDLPSVIGDRVQLQQVILNLVTNGIEAMSAVADRSRRLTFASEALNTGEVVLTVRDSGVGVEPTMLDRLFEPFFTTKARGMGMGLSVSRSIIERHGGRLWASTTPGAGATFHVVLPMAASASIT
ncbi:MAG TPA: ATP-binding protein [Vicinamibacterales bacterium]|jgi:C4-dicarboxylate-specific signal transduction histidine kinase|nr:ATP-binding protein [Vicinamibacterales bacterium]